MSIIFTFRHCDNELSKGKYLVKMVFENAMEVQRSQYGTINFVSRFTFQSTEDTHLKHKCHHSTLQLLFKMTINKFCVLLFVIHVA